MKSKWTWLLGRGLSLGRVVSVFEETATVIRGGNEFRMNVNSLLHEDYKSRDRCAASMSEPINRRVVCAAIRAADGELLLGIRHYSRDMHRQIEARTDGAKFQGRLDEDQGFVDQYGNWMTREEAYQVANAAGQIVRPEACGNGLNGPKLYSEGLY
jgi:hypothetical protein